MSIAYTRVGWEDAPSTNTPIDASNLNHMDNGILALSDNYDQDIPDHEQRITDLENGFDALAPARMERILGDFATVETDSDGRASKTYNVGARFVFNDYLYKATTTINQYDIITDGVNCEKVTVDSEFAAVAVLQDQVARLIANTIKYIHLNDYFTLQPKNYSEEYGDYSILLFKKTQTSQYIPVTGEYYDEFAKAFLVIVVFAQNDSNTLSTRVRSGFYEFTKIPYQTIQYGEMESYPIKVPMQHLSISDSANDGVYMTYIAQKNVSDNEWSNYFSMVYYYSGNKSYVNPVKVSFTILYRDSETPQTS